MSTPPFKSQVLRQLIEFRPNQRREELMNLLLSFCAFDNTVVRKAALKATWRLADCQSKWEAIIEDRAIERLRRVLQPQPSVELLKDMLNESSINIRSTSQWNDETCQLCAHLFLGLMPRNPGKLLLT